MSHVPSGLIGHPKFPLELLGRNAFLGRTDHVDREKPLDEWQMGVVEDGSYCHRKLVPTIDILIQVPGLAGLPVGVESEDPFAVAFWADGASGPSQALEVGDALFLGVKPLKNLNNRSLFAAHSSSIW